MSDFINAHPIITILAAIMAGIVIGAFFIWRGLGGRFLP